VEQDGVKALNCNRYALDKKAEFLVVSWNRRYLAASSSLLSLLLLLSLYGVTSFFVDFVQIPCRRLNPDPYRWICHWSCDRYCSLVALVCAV